MTGESNSLAEPASGEALPDLEEGSRPTLSISQAVMRGDELAIKQRDIEDALVSLRWPQLKKRRYSLLMPELMEAAWVKSRNEGSIRLIQASLTVTFVLYTASFGFLYFGMGITIDPILMLVFIVFGCPGNIALTWVTMKRSLWPLMRSVTMMGTIWHTLGMALFYARAAQIGVRVPTELLAAQMIFDLFLLSLTVRDSSKLIGMAMLIAPLAAIVATDTPAQASTSMFFTAGIASISLIGCYMAERVERISWLRQILLRFIAERDTLTGLLNHGAFYSRAERILRHARRVNEPVALITMDVDFFKRYNDTFGHPAGDDCLRRVSRVIESTGRRPLDIAGRLGGEEFSLLLFGAALPNAHERAEALREEIRTLQKPDGAPITASFGVAWFAANHGDTLSNLLSRADTALYQAKQGGRDRVCVAPSMGLISEAPVAA